MPLQEETTKLYIKISPANNKHFRLQTPSVDQPHIAIQDEVEENIQLHVLIFFGSELHSGISSPAHPLKRYYLCSLALILQCLVCSQPQLLISTSIFSLVCLHLLQISLVRQLIFNNIPPVGFRRNTTIRMQDINKLNLFIKTKKPLLCFLVLYSSYQGLTHQLR